MTAGGVWLVVALSFVVGAALGSFFNVVAYRLPRGMSLNRPGSRCPACGRPIRWHDNVPILGWLWLRGRCRDCRAAISPRYPLVELLVAVASAAVCWSAIAPTAEPEAGLNTLDAALLGFRLLLVYALVCAALLEFDGHRPPLALLLVVLAVGAILPIAWPDLRPPPSAGFAAGVNESGRMLAAAFLLGLLAWPMLAEKADRAGIRGAAARVIELALVGVFLGLAAVAAIAAFAAACFLATRILARFYQPAARFGWAAAVGAGTLIWIMAGGEIAERLPGGAASTLATAGAIVGVMSIAARAAGAATRAGATSRAGDHD